jgi:hypothetical protein
LDFSRASRYDVYWDLLERLTFSQLEDELAADVNKMAHLWHCSAAQVTGLDDDEKLFEFHREKAQSVYTKTGKMLLPWYKIWKAEEGRSLAEMWRQFKEREKDPEYAAFLQKERDRLRQVVQGAQFDAKARDQAAKAYKAELAARDIALKRRRARFNDARLQTR